MNTDQLIFWVRYNVNYGIVKIKTKKDSSFPDFVVNFIINIRHHFNLSLPTSQKKLGAGRPMKIELVLRVTPMGASDYGSTCRIF